MILDGLKSVKLRTIFTAFRPQRRPYITSKAMITSEGSSLSDRLCLVLKETNNGRVVPLHKLMLMYVNNLFCTYVDEFGDISGLEVVKNRGLVEIRQVRHVLATLKLRRVDLGAKQTCAKPLALYEFLRRELRQVKTKSRP